VLGSVAFEHNSGGKTFSFSNSHVFFNSIVLPWKKNIPSNCSARVTVVIYKYSNFKPLLYNGKICIKIKYCFHAYTETVQVCLYIKYSSSSGIQVL
jgi:hypothetical protein